jgi:hypothetical protein
MTLPPESGSHNEMHNLLHGKRLGQDKSGAVYAGIQARSNQIDWCGAEHSGHSSDLGLPCITGSKRIVKPGCAGGAGNNA